MILCRGVYFQGYFTDIYQRDKRGYNKRKTTATEWLTKSEKKSLPALAKVQGRFFHRLHHHSYVIIAIIIPYKISKNIPEKNRIINQRRIVAITDATFGNVLLSKNRGRIMIVPINATANGYRKPYQNDSFHMSTLPIPRKIQSNNNIPQALRVPCFALDSLKS
jgi:hypothetical protein